MKLILARKILPVTSAPIDNGALCVNGGIIADLGTRSRLLRRYGRARVIDLGRAVLMPGLVNAHTHMELSHMHGRITSQAGFFDWISKLIELRRSTGTKDVEKAAKRAIMSAVRSGTTCIGDISATETALAAIVKSGLRAKVYLEVIGLDDAAADETFDRLVRRLKSLDCLSSRITAGISPHSTYSVSGKLYNNISNFILSNRLSTAVHLSETIDETSHITGGKSAIDRYHDMLGWEEHPKNEASSPLGFLIDKGLGKGLLAVHAVHVSARDIGLMSKHGISVAHCPRSNHILGVGKAPVTRMTRKGLNVSIGTDSLASNLDVDLWEEMRFAHIIHRMSAETLVRMATINGAAALGLGHVTGSLESGKAADMIAVSGSAATADEPYTPLLYETRPENVKLVMVDGRTIHRQDSI